MNAEEKEKFTKMEQGVEDIRVDIAEIKHALIGNTLSGDRGLMGQVVILKNDLEYFKKELESVQKEAILNGQVITQLKYVTGIAVACLIPLIFKLIFT